MSFTNTVKIIEDSHFLAENDLTFIKNNVANLQENWEKRQQFRTETEMIVSVLNDAKHPTPAAKYWQAIREQAVFYQELVRLSFEYRRNEIAIKQLEFDIAEASGYEKDRFQIDLEEKLFGKMNMDSTAKDRMREIKLWDSILNTLDDGSFDNKDVNTHQLESFTHRFSMQAKTVNANTPPADAGNIMGLHNTTQRVTHTGIGVCNEFKKQIESADKARLEKQES